MTNRSITQGKKYIKEDKASHLWLAEVRRYNQGISHEHKYHNIERCGTKHLEFLREIEENGNASMRKMQQNKCKKPSEVLEHLTRVN